MRTIHKYTLDIAAAQILSIPQGYKVLSVQVQNNRPCLWVEVDDNAPLVDTTFYIYGTGHAVTHGAKTEYVGTCLLEDGAFVAHVYRCLWGELIHD